MKVVMIFPKSVNVKTITAATAKERNKLLYHLTWYIIIKCLD